MCGRYYNRRQKQQIAEQLRARTVFDTPYEPNFNIAPSTFQPVIRNNRDEGFREMILMRWGLIPHFARSIQEFKGFSTINAKAESISTSPTWRGPFKTRRCLVPADGFYEWRKLDEAKKPAKQPFSIFLKSGEPMAFAGLWDAWKEPKKSLQETDTWLKSFSIVTTEANEIMAPIHARMPVILPERDWQRWLNRDPEAPPPIDLLRPFDADAMQTACCNPLVGNVRNNGPEMLNSA